MVAAIVPPPGITASFSVAIVRAPNEPRLPPRVEIRFTYGTKYGGGKMVLNKIAAAQLVETLQRALRADEDAA
jgi:hypothetical protein